MNTKEFMALTGIKFPGYISNYIKRDIIAPVKVNGMFDFSDDDVKIMLAYLKPEKARELRKSEIALLKEEHAKEFEAINKKLESLEKAVDFLKRNMPGAIE